jgi:hypothetical protein
MDSPVLEEPGGSPGRTYTHEPPDPRSYRCEHIAAQPSSGGLNCEYVNIACIYIYMCVCVCVCVCV